MKSNEDDNFSDEELAEFRSMARFCLPWEIEAIKQVYRLYTPAERKRIHEIEAELKHYGDQLDEWNDNNRQGEKPQLAKQTYRERSIMAQYRLQRQLAKSRSKIPPRLTEEEILKDIEDMKNRDRLKQE